jgi:hypothetical protein
MTQPAMHAQMGGSVAGIEELIPAGAVTFGLMYRTNVGGRETRGSASTSTATAFLAKTKSCLGWTASSITLTTTTAMPPLKRMSD